MKRVVLMITSLVIVFTSCKKDNSDVDHHPSNVKDYMQLEVGNFWVYERYYTDTLGNEIELGDPDSLIITGDTLIGDKLYFIRQEVSQEHISYLRDSSGYLVDQQGNILFSPVDFDNVLRQDTLDPELAYIEYRMVKGDTLISAPIGKYPCLNLRGTVTSLQSGYPHGTQYTYYFWSDGLGMIKSSAYFYNNPSIRTGQRLIRFGHAEMAD